MARRRKEEPVVIMLMAFAIGAAGIAMLLAAALFIGG